MKTAAMQRRLPAVVLFSLFFLLTGCRRDEGVPDAWTRFDLRENPPNVSSGTVREEPRTLGDGRRRTVRGQPDRPVASEVHALVAAAGARLSWRLSLGREPYLYYLPLGRSRRNCVLTYEVFVRGEDGELRRLHAAPLRPFRIYAPAALELPLNDFAGQTVSLFLSAKAEGKSCRATMEAVWGNPTVWFRGPAPKPPGRPKQPNVLLVGLDTLRADALGVYGREPSPSPAIDALAAESDVYLHAFSTFNTTNPSFTSILTGLYGKNHGVYDFATPLPETYPTLASELRAAGYETAAILSVQHLQDKRSGLGRGFDHVDITENQYSAAQAVGLAADWISEREAPFFLWLHLFDAHMPLTPPEPYVYGQVPVAPALGPVEDWTPATWAEKPSPGEYLHLYTSEVAFLDRHLGRLFDFLRSRGLHETTVVALVADHGENLGEHGIESRHIGLWDTTTHVPLIIRWPGKEREGRRLRELVQTVDLFPTLLGAAGVEVPEQDGRNLRSERFGRRLVFAEVQGGGVMVRTPDHLYYRTEEGSQVPAGPYLFDLRADPGQEHNVAGQGLAVEAELAAYADAWLAERRSNGEAPSVALSDEELSKLRDLGYLDP